MLIFEQFYKSVVIYISDLLQIPIQDYELSGVCAHSLSLSLSPTTNRIKLIPLDITKSYNCQLSTYSKAAASHRDIPTYKNMYNVC